MCQCGELGEKLWQIPLCYGNSLSCGYGMKVGGTRFGSWRVGTRRGK